MMIPILLIEDDLPMRATIRGRLMSLGFQVIALDLPVEVDDLLLAARQACQQHQPAAVVVDLGLRGRDSGPVVIRELLKLEYSPRVVAITGEPNGPAVDLVPDGVQVLAKDKKLLPADDSVGTLETALQGIGAGMPGLSSRVGGYLEGLRVASELWLFPHDERLSYVAQRLRYARDYTMTSPDHKKAMEPLLVALGEPIKKGVKSPAWPPNPVELERLRETVLKTASLLDGTSQRETVHLLTHDISNNFLLGWQLLQGAVNDRRAALRLLQALDKSDPRFELVERCTKLLGTVEQPAPRAAVEELNRILKEEQWWAPTDERGPVHLAGWGQVQELLIVENDPVLRSLLASILCHAGRVVKTTLCGNAVEALEKLEELGDSPGVAMLLDLSLPFKAGEQAESPEHGLILLAKAKELKIPVVVVSGVVEFPGIVTRCQDNRPWAYLLKEDHRELVDRLLSLFPTAVELGQGNDRTLHLLVWTSRHALLMGKTVQFGRSGHRLLELLGAEPNQELGVRKVFLNLLNEGHIQPQGDAELSPKAKLGRVRHQCQEVTKVLEQAFLGNQGSIPEILVRTVGDDYNDAKVRCGIPIKLYQQRLDVAPADVRPRLLLLESDKAFANAVTGWLETLTPSPEVVRVRDVEAGRRHFEQADPPHIVVLEPAGLGKEHWLDWVGELRQASPPPNLIVLTGLDEDRLRVRVAERFGEPVHHVVKSDGPSTMSRFCLAYTDITSRRAGLPILEKTGARPPFLIKLPTIVKGQSLPALPVEIDGLPIELRGDDVQALFLVLADHPLQYLRIGRLREAIEGWEVARNEEGSSLNADLYNTVKKLRKQISKGFARHGWHIDSQEMIRNGYGTYWLNGIVIR